MAPTPVSRSNARKHGAISTTLFGAKAHAKANLRRVSFKPVEPERKENSEEEPQYSDSDSGDSDVESTQTGTPSPTSSRGKQDTPYPNRKRAAPQTVEEPSSPSESSSTSRRRSVRYAPIQKGSPTSSTTPSKRSRLSTPSRNRRKPKRPSLTLFSSKPTVKARPSSTLTAYLSYTLDKLPTLIKKLKKDTEMCHSLRINKMGKLDEILLEKITRVGSLKVDQDDDRVMDKKYEVLDEMQEAVLQLQRTKEHMEAKLEEDRRMLRAETGMYECCKICYKSDNEQSQPKKTPKKT